MSRKNVELRRGKGGDEHVAEEKLRRWDGHWGRDTFLPDGAAACNDYADISPWADDSLYWACISGRMECSAMWGRRLSPIWPSG